MAKISVIGAGSWGTALAQLLARNNHDISLWALEKEVADSINLNHFNNIYLSHHKLSDKIVATNSLEEAILGSSLIVVVVPSQFLRSTCEKFEKFVERGTPIVICSKGAEEKSGKLASEIVNEIFGDRVSVAILSGPTHAEEVINSIPSAATCACENMDVANQIRDIFSSESFRVYTSTDVIGVEICATFKNVIAIAVGLSYGIGFGDNTAAMIITRGIAEMRRVVQASGGSFETVQGLAGVGDLVVTCMSHHSRNRRFGQDYIACGKTLDDFVEDTKMVVEGASAARNLRTLAEKYSVELPITDMIYEVVWEGADPAASAHKLRVRPLREEFDSN